MALWNSVALQAHSLYTETAKYSLLSSSCRLKTDMCAQCTVQCTLCNVHCALYTVHYKLYTYESTSLKSSPDDKCLETNVVQNIKLHILCSIPFQKYAVYDMWKNVIQPDRTQIGM